MQDLGTFFFRSQCPAAVGRALGIGLVQQLGVNTAAPSDAISFVSIGDGSINNAHSLAALNTAERRFHWCLNN